MKRLHTVVEKDTQVRQYQTNKDKHSLSNVVEVDTAGVKVLKAEDLDILRNHCSDNENCWTDRTNPANLKNVL